MLSAFIFLIGALLSFGASAGEVDALTLRYRPLQDSGEDFDHEINRRLNLALQEVKDEKCLKEKPTGSLPQDKVSEKAGTSLINALSEQFQSRNFLGTYMGKLENWAEDSLPNSKRHNIRLSASIHADEESGFLPNIISFFELNPHVRVHGIYIGTDKIGHFFQEGMRNYIARSMGERAILKRSISAWEGSETGMSTTGVLSYADLAANFSGQLYWENVWRSSNAYFVCDPKTNRWQRTDRNFSFRDYIHNGWDEGINCNEYSPEKNPQINKRISALEAKNPKQKFSCPVDETACVCLNQRFMSKERQKYLIGPGCRGKTAQTQVLCQGAPTRGNSRPDEPAAR
jgi:hypothetical protein